MKKKEAILAISLATAMATTGCASQTDVDAMSSQITELTAQMESLQTELSEAQAESNATTSMNAELESQVANLQEQLENAETELEDAENTIKSADDDIAEMTINVTKYAQAGTAVYTKAEENEENKIAELDLNDEVYVVSVFSANDGNNWSAVGVLKTTDKDGNETYQIITSAIKGEDRVRNKNVDFFFKKIATITVDGKTIKADELGENQEIRIVYARTSLLSNSKVTEQQKTSAEKSSTPKQSTQQQTAPADDGWGNCITPGCPSMTGMNIQFH